MGSDLKHQTVDEVINEIGEKPTVLLVFLALWAMSVSMVATNAAYMIQFTGFIPLEDWTCLSQSCLDLQETQTKDRIVNPNFYDLTTICDNDMVYDVDYSWNISRTTLAIEFDLICRNNELSLLTSLYFVGAMFGLVIGMSTFEMFGRRRTSACGAVLYICATCIAIFCHNYWMLIVLRMLQGIGQFLAYNGTYVWCLELAPEKYRLYYNSVAMLIWAAGYPVLVCMAYFIETWNYIYIAATALSVCCYFPLFILPDSPRFLMAIGKTDEAKAVLESYSKLWDTDKLDLRNTILLTSENNTTKEESSIKEMLKGYWENKAMLFETVVQLWIWFVCCLLFYGLNYGWSGFGDSPYVNYLYAAIGEVIAYCSIVPITIILGRRLGMTVSLLGAFVSFLLGMISWQWTAVWNLERLMSLVANMMNSIAFGLVFLYTGELAPTTHRGFTNCAGSGTARFAAFMGPFVTTTITNSRAKLGLNMFMAGSAMVLTLLLPETRQLPIPECAADVTKRRKTQNVPFYGGKLDLKSKSLPSALKALICG